MGSNGKLPLTQTIGDVCDIMTLINAKVKFQLYLSVESYVRIYQGIDESDCGSDCNCQFSRNF